MLNSALDTVLGLLRVTCRGVPFFESQPAAHSTPSANLIYRLKTWPQLHGSERTAANYRVLSVMSSRPVTRQWILSRAGRNAQKLDALLRQLTAAGAIEVIDPGRFAAREPCRA